MGVNTNTVLRALRILRDEGLLEMRPRRGITVVGTPTESAVRNRVAELVSFARAQGYTHAETRKMVHRRVLKRNAGCRIRPDPALCDDHGQRARYGRADGDARG